MRIASPKQNRGVAMIIVMLVIVVLSVLAGGFAYSMKVETKLARNTSWESDMEWLGRSGVELGKYALAMQLTLPPPESMYTGLNQFWAGAPPNPTNEVFIGLSLTNVQLGPGKFSVSIQDTERRFNLSAITQARPDLLIRALEMVGTDNSEVPIIVSSYLDWIDPDKKSQLDGAETEDYLLLDPPYCAKNGPVDDIRELLLIKGMTPQIFWGTTRVGEAIEVRQRGKNALRRPMSPYVQSIQPTPMGAGLVDLFTPINGSGQLVNINTASAEVLRLAGLDETAAAAIVSARNGPDGTPSTEDDVPFLNPQEALMAAGLDAQVTGALRNAFTVQSRVFEVTVDAEISNYKRRFVALVNRQDRSNVTTLYFSWK